MTTQESSRPKFKVAAITATNVVVSRMDSMFKLPPTFLKHAKYHIGHSRTIFKPLILLRNTEAIAVRYRDCLAFISSPVSSFYCSMCSTGQISSASKVNEMEKIVLIQSHRNAKFTP
jgi:hypothetical protein